MSRSDALARLAAAYARHQAVRVVRRRRSQVQKVLDTYAPDHFMPLTRDERDALPAISRCINCGICALVAGRIGSVSLPDAASGYLRDYPRLQLARGDLEGAAPGAEALAAATAACPVGVPLEGVAAMLARLSRG